MKNLGIVTAFFLLALWIAPEFSTVPYDQQDAQNILSLPSSAHWLGTDALGRDLLSRCLFGTRVSVFLGLLATLISFAIGIFLGVLSVWLGGIQERILQRSWDLFSAIPQLILVILVKFFIDPFFTNTALPSLWTLLLVLGGLQWMSVARLMRILVHRWRVQPFIEASQAIGASRFEILRSHILPNSIPSLISFALIQIPHLMLLESFLSFIGFGLQPPLASWGVLIQEAWRSFSSYPHLILGPSLFLFLTLLVFNYLADSFRKKYSLFEDQRGF